MTSLTITLIIIAVVAVAVAIFMYVQWERTKRLRGKFGPEYDRLVHNGGSARKAENELLDRQRRIEKLHIRDLNQAEIDRFSSSWRAVQTEFVDSPREAVAQADRLICDVMTTRGYPMSNFNQQAADISVDHPNVVEHYRTAHAIAERDGAGSVNTEDLRQAMMHYRALFEELLSTPHERQMQEVRK